MAITFHEMWIPAPDGRTRVRLVYRHDSIGHMRRWQEDEGDMTRKWFTAKRKKGAFYALIAGENATFEEAMERIIFYSVTQ